jgi:hypothetical protein
VQVLQRKWHTVAEVADMLGYGLTKTKMLVATGQIRSLKRMGGTGECCRSGWTST